MNVTISLVYFYEILKDTSFKFCLLDQRFYLFV